MAKKTPVPKAYKDGKYLFTIELAGYPIHYFDINTLSDGNVAEWHPRSDEIYVTPAPSDKSRADRELHELLHAICTITMPVESRMSELQVNTLSTVLLDTLARNPNFLNRLLKLIGARR